jgi:site-specific DNA recombinase
LASACGGGGYASCKRGSCCPGHDHPTPCGWTGERPRDPAGVRVEEAEAAVVRELFAQYLEPGGSLAGLAKHLYALGVPTPTGQRCWRPNTIRLILTNPAYTAQVYAGRRRVRRAQLRWSALRPVGHHGESATPSPPETWLAVAPIPALVSQDQFDQAQAKLAQNQQFARRHTTAHSYLLRALVSCGVCQLGCVGRWSHPGYTSYCCRGKTHPIQSGRQQRCRARFIPAAQLDELVWGDLCDLLTHPQSLHHALHHALERAHGGHWLPQEPQALQARREQWRRGRQQLEAQLDRLSEAYLQGVMPLAEYRRRRQTLEQRQNALARQIEQLETQARDHQALVGVVASVDALCQRVQAGLAQATFEQKRHRVELLIDRVIVTNGDVEIRYVIPTTPASEHVRFCYLRTDYFDPEPLAIPGDRLLCAGLIRRQIPGLIRPRLVERALHMARQAPAEGDIDPQITGATLVALPIAHVGRPPDLTRSQPFRPQPRARAVSGNQARPSRDAHHVVKAVLLQPRKKGGAGKATVS